MRVHGRDCAVWFSRFEASEVQQQGPACYSHVWATVRHQEMTEDTLGTAVVIMSRPLGIMSRARLIITKIRFGLYLSHQAVPGGGTWCVGMLAMCASHPGPRFDATDPRMQAGDHRG